MTWYHYQHLLLQKAKILNTNKALENTRVPQLTSYSINGQSKSAAIWSSLYWGFTIHLKEHSSPFRHLRLMQCLNWQLNSHYPDKHWNWRIIYYEQITFTKKIHHEVKFKRKKDIGVNMKWHSLSLWVSEALDEFIHQTEKSEQSV